MADLQERWSFLSHAAGLSALLSVGAVTVSVIYNFAYFSEIDLRSMTFMTVGDHIASSVASLPPLIFGLLMGGFLRKVSPLPDQVRNVGTDVFGILGILLILADLLLGLGGIVAAVGMILLVPTWVSAIMAKMGVPEPHHSLIQWGIFLALSVFVVGTSSGRFDLRFSSNFYDLTLVGAKFDDVVVLRNLERGVLIRDPNRQVISFHPWSRVIALEREKRLQSSKGLVCITTGFTCNWSI